MSEEFCEIHGTDFEWGEFWGVEDTRRSRRGRGRCEICGCMIRPGDVYRVQRWGHPAPAPASIHPDAPNTGWRTWHKEPGRIYWEPEPVEEGEYGLAEVLSRHEVHEVCADLMVRAGTIVCGSPGYAWDAAALSAAEEAVMAADAEGYRSATPERIRAWWAWWDEWLRDVCLPQSGEPKYHHRHLPERPAV